MKLKKYRWPNNTVSYRIDESLEGDKEIIKEAMYHIMNKTLGCIDFVEIEGVNQTQPYVLIKRADDCRATVGVSVSHIFLNFGENVFQADPKRPETSITLNTECLSKMGHIVHELLHTLGMVHEHQRPDRDKYVVIKEQLLLVSSINL